MRTAAGVEHLRLFGVDEVVVGTLNRVLIAIPKRIEKFLSATGAGLVLAPDRRFEGCIGGKILIFRKKLTVRAMENFLIRVIKQGKDGGSFQCGTRGFSRN